MIFLPDARLPKWVERVNEPLTEGELAAIRFSRSGAVSWERKDGWNQLPDVSIWSPRAVRVAGNACASKSGNQANTPDP